jgi:hypothetical protein
MDTQTCLVVSQNGDGMWVIEDHEFDDHIGPYHAPETALDFARRLARWRGMKPDEVVSVNGHV